MWYSTTITILSAILFLIYLCYIYTFPLSYLLLIGIALIIISSLWVKYVANKYLNKSTTYSMTGGELAHYILNKEGLGHIRIIRAKNFLGEYYDPTNQVIAISDTALNSNSISSYAIITHEIGHALQHKNGYFPIKIRSLFIFLANIIQFFSIGLLAMSLFVGRGIYLDFLIASVGVSVLIQLFTLPVEINASIRAYNILLNNNLISKDESRAVKKVLKAAAYTYIASLLSSILNLIRLLIIRENNR